MSSPTLVSPPTPAITTAVPLTKKILTADHPTWCPGCGDFAVLASFYRVLEKLQYPHEKIVTFDEAVALIKGQAGDGFSIGGNHLVHTARKNVNLTYVIMDNSVYGLTKKQTSPTSPIGFKTKTDPTGAIDQPINPMRTLLNTGATFVARSHATQVNHMVEMMTRAAKHPGFSVVEILSECVEFYAGAFDSSIPRKGGTWSLIQEKKNDGTPEDADRHDVTDEVAAFKLAGQAWPGSFGVFYENNARKPKHVLEAELVTKARERTKNATDLQLLQATFAKMR